MKGFLVVRWWEHSGHYKSIRDVSSAASRSVQGHPDYTRLKGVFKCAHAGRPGGGWEGGLSLVGLAYNSDRVRELKAAQRYDGQAKWSLHCALFE